MPEITVAATEFKNRAGLYMEQSGKSPVFITRHNRRVRVLLDIDEYERLKAGDTRRAYYAHELPGEWVEALDKADTGHIDPQLDRLMDDLVKRPDPAPGLVIRYDYLWRDEAARGREEGAKARPCAIVVALQAGKDREAQVLLAAMAAIEIPPRVKQHLGLDDERSWIVTAEVNAVAWNDPGIVPATRSRWVYGFLPPKLTNRLIERVREIQRDRALSVVDRSRGRHERDNDDAGSER
jgi:prevent-host-death family protein